MGTTAARILIERVRGDNGPAKHIVLETALKIRDSVAPPQQISGTAYVFTDSFPEHHTSRKIARTKAPL